MEVKINKKKVTKVIETEVNNGVTLTLSNEEAAALFALTSQVNSTNKFIGQFCDKIFFTLEGLGFKLNTYVSTSVDSDTFYKGISFESVELPKNTSGTVEQS
jgi:hypothetical protein